MHCLHCDKPIKGRVDKKFCDDWCRNAYNNKLNSVTSTPVVRNINSILKRNRRILKSVLSPEKETARISKRRLIETGFNFDYLTHLVTTPKGQVYLFCYEYGYLPLENDFYLIVARNRYREESI
ncbi:MAG: DUF2116 family Zn-ribbon domain-containing protein [Chitinophagaceae bacterium]|nr:DUF2116 family Zn-ribbon domain-containing protein [Chitinophagaceae bacterium]